MSKAFTSEETDVVDPTLELEDVLPPGPRYITPEGFERLRTEHERLRTVERPRIAAALLRAGGPTGDGASEAAHALRLTDRRLQWIERRLERLTVVRSAPAGDRVAFGAWVTVELEDGSETTWRLVGPDEIDVARGHLNVLAPVGAALIGRSPGDEVVVARPRGPLRLTVVDVRYTPLDG